MADEVPESGAAAPGSPPPGVPQLGLSAAQPAAGAAAPQPPPLAARPRFATLRLILLLALAALAGWMWGHRQPPSSLPTRIAAAEARVAPSVVKIQVESPGLTTRGRFLLPPGGRPPEARTRVEHSLGSGLILDAAGDILTNSHVVSRAERIAVTVPGDQHVYYARLLGADTDTDLAVVKINAGHPLPAASFGDSGRLKVGDAVVAIGAPFGLANSVTSGIVSALNRSVNPAHQFQTFIQTDAPINPGNSGGPLVNLSGQVVGINTEIETTSQVYQGVGFALPSDLIQAVYPQLVKSGHVTRGSIGVYFEGEVDPAVRRVYGLATGVPVSQVVPKGPAARAGLEAGDVITSVNGANVANGMSLMRALIDVPVGSTVRVGFERSGKTRAAMVAVVDRASLYPPAPASAAPKQAAPPADLGMTLANSPRGVRVSGVTLDSFADSIGIRADDILVEINRRPVRRVADVTAWAAAARPGSDVAVIVTRPNPDGTASRWLLGGTIPPPALITPALVGEP